MHRPRGLYNIASNSVSCDYVSIDNLTSFSFLTYKVTKIQTHLGSIGERIINQAVTEMEVQNCSPGPA